MRIEEIAQRILSIHGRGVQDEEARLTVRHAYHKMASVRGLLLSQKVRKRQKVGQWSYQTLPCAELVAAPAHECPCLPPVGCTTLRTRHRLPAPLQDMDRHLIQSVTSVDGSVHYSETSWAEKKYRRANKWTGRRPDWYVRQGHLYITAVDGPEAVSVTGLFGDPLEAALFPSLCPTDADCTGYADMEFPMDADLVDALVEMCARELLGASAPAQQQTEGQ